MWLLDRFLNPLWHKVSRLPKNQRRTLATILCSYDFFRQQIEKKLLGPAEAFLKRDSQTKIGISGLPEVIRKHLVDEALLGLLSCCRSPAFDPGRKLPRRMVDSMPDLWAALVLADKNQAPGLSSSGSVGQVRYSENPGEAHAQVLACWKEILGVTSPAFEPQIDADGFEEAWNWIVEMFIADTLQGMAIVPDKMLFSQARRVVAATSPPHTKVVEHLIEQVAASPESLH